MILWQKVALALTLATSTLAAYADAVVYVIGDSGQFGTINLSTGSFTAIGPGLGAGSGGLVRGPGGSLLSLGFDGNLNSINPSTGVMSTVGATGLGDCSLPTSACGPNSANLVGQLGASVFATDLANNLYSINPVTGAATLIGPTGIPGVPFTPKSGVPGDPDGSFYIYDESLFDYGGNLYANMDAGIFDPVTFTPTSLIDPNIYRINTLTGAATLVTATDFGLGTITNVNGTLYAFDLPISSVVTLNLADGSTTVVNGTDPAVGLVEELLLYRNRVLSLLVGSGLTAIAAGMRKRFVAR